MEPNSKRGEQNNNPTYFRGQPEESASREVDGTRAVELTQKTKSNEWIACRKSNASA
jgi:hypothetical protein